MPNIDYLNLEEFEIEAFDFYGNLMQFASSNTRTPIVIEIRRYTIDSPQGTT